jgi:hypothetical protein
MTKSSTTGHRAMLQTVCATVPRPMASPIADATGPLMASMNATAPARTRPTRVRSNCTQISVHIPPQNNHITPIVASLRSLQTRSVVHQRDRVRSASAAGPAMRAPLVSACSCRPACAGNSY